MRTNFARLRRDLAALFAADRPPPKALLFVIFMLPAAVLVREAGLPEGHHAFAPAMYLAGGVIAWALIRGAEPPKDGRHG